MPSYAHITAPTNTRTYRGGYKDIFRFVPIADFATIASPTATPSALGDKVKITTAHTWTGTNGYFEYETQQQTVNIASETVGDAGAKLLKHTAKFNILGDGASTQEQLQNLLNSKVIAFVKDAKCDATEYVQLGDDCIQPEFSVAFNGATTKEGSKVYEVTAVVTDAKYFYSGAFTKNSA
jgi:hypothetical protein